jgi:hypothetical protein
LKSCVAKKLQVNLLLDLSIHRLHILGKFVVVEQIRSCEENHQEDTAGDFDEEELEKAIQ